MAGLYSALLLPGGALLLLGCRCAPLLLAVPGFGWAGRGVALLLGTLLAAPLLAPALPASSLLGPQLVPLAVRELLIGGVLTLAAALPWAVVYSVGALLDSGRVRQTVAPRPLAAPLYGALAVALFFGLGGARIVVAALAASYELLPLPTVPRSPTVPVAVSLAAAAPRLAGLGGQLLAVALRLALPLLAAQLLAELLLALGSGLTTPRPPQRRRAPVAGSLLGLAVLLLGVHALLPQLRQLMTWLPALLRQALDALAPT